MVYFPVQFMYQFKNHWPIHDPYKIFNTYLLNTRNSMKSLINLCFVRYPYLLILLCDLGSHRNSNILVTWCEELTHWKRPWCWERLKAGGEGDDRGWDGQMASLTLWIWVWVSSRSWWWAGKPGMLQSTGSQRVGHDWVTKLNPYLPLELSRWC